MIIKILHNYTFLIFLLTAAMSCSRQAEDFTRGELRLIDRTDSIMRVLTTESEDDMAVLRAQSRDFSAKALSSEDFSRLSRLMLATVTHPSQDGVGIAAPQVGLNRRVVAVQRFDKPGFPFEVYPNISIVWSSDSLACGPEGCLSVPGRRGEVMRSREIIIEYAELDRSSDPKRGTDVSRGHKQTGHTTSTGIRTRRDTISGFTAVIFQHEVDHLDGVLYIDKLPE